MKEMTLEDIKSVSLEILSDVDTFCRNNNINYSIAFGTGIGAIRHHGFIPWDDDIDIVMPRPDYDLFCKQYKSTNGFIVYTRDNSDIAFARVCDMNKTYVDCAYLPWTNTKTGIWIDVFPVDGIEDNDEIATAKCVKIKKLYKKGVRARRSKAKFSTCTSVKDFLKLLLFKVLYHGNTECIDQYIDMMKQVDYADSTSVAHLSCPIIRVKDIYKKELFGDYIDIPFENIKVRSVKDYDTLLRTSFGDYMQLPPVDKRIPVHGYDKFYWK